MHEYVLHILSMSVPFQEVPILYLFFPVSVIYVALLSLWDIIIINVVALL